MKNTFKLGCIIAITLTFSSCSVSEHNLSIKKHTENTGQSVQSQAKGNKNQLNPTYVNIPTIEEIVNRLSSDEFEGRLTGSEGNKKTEEYIYKTFSEIGLNTIFENGYYEKYSQEVISTYGGNGNDSKVEMVNNVVGLIKGKDNKKAVVISAHFDHIGYINGKIIRGALDNASGIAALIEIAKTLNKKASEKPFDTNIIICAFNGEEEALRGSVAFVNDIKSKFEYKSLYNINIDSIGAKNGGKLALKNLSKVSDKLFEYVKTSFKNNNISFADTNVKGFSDNASFESENIPNVFIVQESIENLVHKTTDTPDILDYNQIKKIADAICSFIETSDGQIF